MGWWPRRRRVTAVRLNAADLIMGFEMYAASPDGQATQAAWKAALDQLPDASVTLSGFWDSAGEER